MEGFFFVAILGIGVAAIVASASGKRRQAVNAAWGDAAARLRLLFRPADLVTSPQILGTIGGCSVHVTTFTRSSDKARCARYRVEFRTPHQQQLEIRERRRLVDFGRIFGQNLLEFGDAEFDARLDVRAPEREAIREFLNPLRRRRLLDLFRDFPGTVIERHRLTWDTKQVPIDAQTLVRAIERLAAAAADLSPDAGGPATEAPTEKPSRKLRPRTPEPPVAEPAHPTPLRGAAAPTPPRPRREPPPPVARPAHLPPKPEAPQIITTPAAAHQQTEPEPPRAIAPSAPAPPAAPPGAAGGPSAPEVARAMFGSTAATPDVQVAFEREFRDRTVRWTGELTSVSRYPFDRVFGSAPGTRAVFHVCDVETSLGRRPVQAVVQLSVDAVQGMRTGVGTSWVFEGTLHACDGFMRTLFVTGGRIVSRPSALPSGKPG